MDDGTWVWLEDYRIRLVYVDGEGFDGLDYYGTEERPRHAWWPEIKECAP